MSQTVPYYCPFCGGEDLRPSAGVEDRDATAAPRDATGTPRAATGMPRAGWECRECTRVFSVMLIGLVVAR